MNDEQFKQYLELFKKAGSTNSAYDKLREMGFPKGFISEIWYQYKLNKLSDEEVDELKLKFTSVLK